MSKQHVERVLITFALPVETADRLERIRATLGISQPKFFNAMIDEFIKMRDVDRTVLY